MKEKNQINLIFGALSTAILEIREEAYIIENPKIYKLSDLIHNLAGAVRQELTKEEPGFQAVLGDFEKRAENSNMSFWLDNFKKEIHSIED